MMTVTKAAGMEELVIREAVEVDGARIGRNLLLFMAAPWIGLAYVIAFPFIGFGAMIKFGLQAAVKKTAS